MITSSMVIGVAIYSFLWGAILTKTLDKGRDDVSRARWGISGLFVGLYAVNYIVNTVGTL